MRVKPGLLEKQPRQQRQQQQSYVNTFENKVQLRNREGSFESTELGLWFLDDIRGEDIIWDSHLQECPLRHHGRRHSEEARATYWENILPLLRTVQCTKIPKLIGKRIPVWGLIALPLQQKLQICKFGRYSCNPKTISGLFQSSNSLTTWANMQCTEFTRPKRRNEFWQTESEPSLRTSLYAGRMRCKSCQRK